MDVYKILYKLNLDNTNSYCKNQSVDICKKNNYLNVVSKQETSTPGIKSCGKINIYKDVNYILTVTGIACRENMAFLWVMDANKNRLFNKYVFLSSVKKSKCSLCFKAPSNTCVQIGVLITAPRVGDNFNISCMKFSEGVNNCNTIPNCNQPCNEPLLSSNSCITNPKPISISCEEKTCENESCNTVSVTNENTSCNYNYSLTEKNYDTVCNTIQNLKQTSENTKCYQNVFRMCEPLYINYNNLLKLSESLYIENIDFNCSIPAGYTFLAEFLFNDITFNMKDCKETKINLGSIYGKDEQYFFSSDKFLINKYHDLNRNKKGIPIIPDERNGKSYFLSQIHLLFQLFHNKLIKKYKNSKSDVYSFVRMEVIRYYQWIILNDYLPKIVDNDILETIKCNDNKFIDYSKTKTLSSEFLKGIMKYTLFSIKKTYKIAKDLIIDSSEIYKYINGKLPKYIIDWNLFFDLNGQNKPQPSKSLDIFITDSLKPKNNIKPEVLNYLSESQEANNCSGQNISEHMKIKPIPDEIIKQFDINKDLERYGVLNHSPILLYSLLESKIYMKGERFTGVGGIILAETIFGLLKNDKDSILNNDWKPSINTSNSFSMSDMIKFIYSDC